METRAHYALIGAFVLLMSAALAGFVLWLGSGQFSRDTKSYDIVFPGPVSLEEGAAVRYIGIKVGEVQSVSIDRRDASQVRVRILVDRTTPVKTDSTATIELAGITGITFVQINAGSSEAPPLRIKPGQTVPVIEAEANPLTQLFARGEALAGGARQLLEQSGTILSDDNIVRFSSLLSSADSLVTTLAEQDTRLITEIMSTLETLQQASTDLSDAARATTQLGQTTEAELLKLSLEVGQLIDEVKGVTEGARLGIQDGQAAFISTRELLDTEARQTLNQSRLAAEDLQRLIERLDRLARELERNPQGFVVGKPMPYEKEAR